MAPSIANGIGEAHGRGYGNGASEGVFSIMVLGMDSGTSMDSADCALCQFTQDPTTSPFYSRLLQVFGLC